MKTANSALLAILSGPADFFYADLWTFALRNGITKRYTDWGDDLVVGGNNFSSSGLLLTGAKYKLQRGLQVDDNTVTAYPSPSEMVNGVTFLQALRSGVFDRATVTRQRQFMATPGNLAANAPTIFLGEVTDSSPTRNMTTLTVKSMVNLLNNYMPRRQYQPTCTWVFGDSNCTFNRPGQTVASAVGAGSVSPVIMCTLSQATGTFNNGVIKFTSGANNGISRSVKSYTVGNITINAPFPNPLVTGDTFNITPGCTKNLGGPVQTFTASATLGSNSVVINNGLTNAAGYFNGGTLEFTSGTNAGQTRIINTWSPGVAVMSSAFPNAPLVGDSFVITSTSTQTQSTCTGYSNQLNFGGFPFVPTPETAY